MEKKMETTQRMSPSFSRRKVKNIPGRYLKKLKSYNKDFGHFLDEFWHLFSLPTDLAHCPPPTPPTHTHIPRGMASAA